MRNRLIIFAAPVLLLLASLAVAAVFPSHCTERGTSGNDSRAGTGGSDFLCLFGGNDYGHGRGGADIVSGGSGNDTLVGGGGHDILRGWAGNDALFSVDGQGGDRIRGGLGNDRCYADHGDALFGCEVRFFGGSPYPKAIVLAMMQALGGSIQTAEVAQLEVTDICGGQPAPPPICEGGKP